MDPTAETITKRIDELQRSLAGHIQAANFHTEQIARHNGAIEELRRLLESQDEQAAPKEQKHDGLG